MISFYNYYKTKGHVFGECMSSPNTDLMYINIPKNASSWTKLNCKDWGWEFFNYHSDNLYHKHSLIVLRDPVDRWLSGIAEYFFLYHKNLDFAHISRPFLDLIFDRVAFDDHTEKQILFIKVASSVLAFCGARCCQVKGSLRTGRLSSRSDKVKMCTGV